MAVNVVGAMAVTGTQLVDRVEMLAMFVFAGFIAEALISQWITTPGWSDRRKRVLRMLLGAVLILVAFGLALAFDVAFI